ncbi:MAG: non-ribosomal peptide synthetase, partial [Stackebrandtia sp.]
LDPTGDSVFSRLTPSLSRRLAAFSRERRTTLFMTLLAAFSTSLHRLSGQDDFVVGTAFADRPEGDEDLVGALLNTLPLRMDLSGDPSFDKVLDRVRDTVMDAYEHGHVPFEQVLEAVNPVRDTSRAPLFQTLMVYEDEEVFAFDLPGVAAAVLDEGPDRALYDLTVYLANVSDGVRVHVEYNTALFDESTVRRFVGLFAQILDAVVDDPARPVSDLDCLTVEDRRLLSRWEHGPDSPLDDAGVHRLVARRAAERPEAIAVDTGAEQLSYADLDAHARALARRLTAAGVGAGSVVAVRLPRGVALVIAQFAVLKAGGAFLAIDPDLPSARIRFMVSDAGCKVAIDADEPSGQDFDGLTVIGVDDRDDVGAELSVDAGPDDLAFVVYTSGSTGKPKGVLTAHRATANVCRWYAEETGLAPGERTTCTAALGFDVCVLEIWAALAAGATLVFPDEAVRRDPRALTAWLAERDVDVAWLPTVVAEAVLEEPEAEKIPARVVVTAGSALRRRPSSRLPFRLINAYGPAEAGILASCCTVSPEGDGPIPIGRPLPNVGLYVLDGNRRETPIGVAGELYIGGDGLAEGYLNRPELTEERFATVDLPDVGARRLYRTGDVARWNRNGELEFLGRNDDQVKIRGNRIEPGEVAHALQNLPTVREAAVTSQPSHDGEDVELAAYIVPADPDAAPDESELASTLSAV